MEQLITYIRWSDGASPHLNILCFWETGKVEATAEERSANSLCVNTTPLLMLNWIQNKLQRPRCLYAYVHVYCNRVDQSSRTWMVHDGKLIFQSHIRPLLHLCFRQTNIEWPCEPMEEWLQAGDASIRPTDRAFETNNVCRSSIYQGRTRRSPSVIGVSVVCMGAPKTALELMNARA